MPQKMIELFCGAGLLGHAFSQNGFDPVFAADLDQDAIKSYNKNSVQPVGEIHDVIDLLDIGANIIVAGPPCQGFSSLGKRDKKDVRNKLSLELARWAKASMASVVVVENVPQFLSSPQFLELQSEMRILGYDSVQWILEAQHHNTPQCRARSFSIFSKIGLPEKPVDSNLLMTVENAFHGLRERTNDPLHFCPPMTELAIERIRHVPTNGGKLDLLKVRPDLCPESWIKVGCQAVDVWGRMDKKKPSNTIRCNFQNPSKGRYIHPSLDRVITLREGARLQGVPDHWEFFGARTSISRQIGNGVPIPLGESVAKEVAKLF